MAFSKEVHFGGNATAIENNLNKVKKIDSNSDDIQYPSARAVFNLAKNKTNTLLFDNQSQLDDWRNVSFVVPELIQLAEEGGSPLGGWRLDIIPQGNKFSIYFDAEVPSLVVPEITLFESQLEAGKYILTSSTIKQLADDNYAYMLFVEYDGEKQLINNTDIVLNFAKSTTVKITAYFEAYESGADQNGQYIIDTTQTVAFRKHVRTDKKMPEDAVDGDVYIIKDPVAFYVYDNGNLFELELGSGGISESEIEKYIDSFLEKGLTKDLVVKGETYERTTVTKKGIKNYTAGSEFSLDYSGLEFKDPSITFRISKYGVTGGDETAVASWRDWLGIQDMIDTAIGEALEGDY